VAKQGPWRSRSLLAAASHPDASVAADSGKLLNELQQGAGCCPGAGDVLGLKRGDDTVGKAAGRRDSVASGRLRCWSILAAAARIGRELAFSDAS